MEKKMSKKEEMQSSVSTDAVIGWHRWKPSWQVRETQTRGVKQDITHKGHVIKQNQPAGFNNHFNTWGVVAEWAKWLFSLFSVTCVRFLKLRGAFFWKAAINICSQGLQGVMKCYHCQVWCCGKRVCHLWLLPNTLYRPEEGPHIPDWWMLLLMRLHNGLLSLQTPSTPLQSQKNAAEATKLGGSHTRVLTFDSQADLLFNAVVKR